MSRMFDIQTFGTLDCRKRRARVEGMETKHTFHLTMQTTLRMASLWVFLAPLAGVAWLYFSRDMWVTCVALICSGLMVLATFLRQYGLPHKWWFFWFGPILIIKKERDYQEVQDWLKEHLPGRYSIPYPYVVKFKNKSTATMFKLTWG